MKTQVETPADIANYYKKNSVANNYIKKRFTDPINALEHQKQVSVINKIIFETNSKKILEFAPGPARLTAELEVENGTSIDISKSMLEIAQKRMKDLGKKWHFRQGDIFKLTLKEQYDLVFAFRFFLHFKRQERDKIYSKVRESLRDEGFLVMEVMNCKVVKLLRKILGRSKYFVYDEIYTKTEFVKEIELNGFRLLKLYPVLSNFWLQAIISRPLKIIGFRNSAFKLVSFFERNRSKNPYEWVALCQKK